MPEVGKRRRYSQACNIARTLDLVGERWTLLLLRELATGPRMYGQLEAALGGIGTNLLADRLKQLESDGLIEREKTPGMRRRRRYALSEQGRLIEPVLVEMERFGIRAGLSGPESDYSRPAWAVLSSRASFRPDIAAGLDEQYEFHVDDEVFHLGIKDGRPANGHGPAAHPVVVASMASDTFARVQSGSLAFSQGIWTGEIEVIAGHEAALDRCSQVFGA